MWEMLQAIEKQGGYRDTFAAQNPETYHKIINIEEFYNIKYATEGAFLFDYVRK